MSPTLTRYAMLLVFVAAAATTPTPASAQEEEVSLGDALTKGKISLNLHYRYEEVDEARFDDRGRASTLRTALGYRTLWWKRLSAFLEFEDVRDVGLGDEHNNGGFGSLWNGVRDRPVIADAPITEINQTYLDWKPLDGLPIRGGRQEIIVDNARFIGNVGWRQNHQSFDGAMIHFNGWKNVSLGYTYIGNQRAISGESRPMSTSQLDGTFTLGNVGTLHAYLLSIEYDQQAQRNLSTGTIGASFAGKAKLSDTLDLTYRLELATQGDTGNNPGSVEADYGRADLGLKVGKVNFGAGYEVLGGAEGEGSFSTPLATLHKFNGWADRFLNTPANGLRDAFVSAGATLGSWKLTAVYHDFSADGGGASWGTEFDGSVVFTTSWKQQFAFKFALYSADEWSNDTDKLWVWTRWGF
jgi:hypothetical protein